MKTKREEMGISTTEGQQEPTSKRYRLRDLLAQITEDNLHDETDFGKPQGKEVAALSKYRF